MRDVPADGSGFHYGFKLKPEIQKEFDEMDEAGLLSGVFLNPNF